MRIGQIGCGWVGGNLAKEFESRGYEVVRYDIKTHPDTHGDIAACDVVFIAVPTPTFKDTGFDDSAIISALRLVGDGKIAVIKSTVLPGTTRKLQGMFPEITVMHCPEFLREASARFDVAAPERNIIGITDGHEEAAKTVLGILPKAEHEAIVDAESAELVKYAGNVFLYMKVVYANMLHDLAGRVHADFNKVSELTALDSRIGPSHFGIWDKNMGRGAGGNCFIKDMAAFTRFFNEVLPDDCAANILNAIERKNLELLINSRKDLDIVTKIYDNQTGTTLRDTTECV